MTRTLVTSLLSDIPYMPEGGYLTIERASGQSVWRQRIKLLRKTHYGYYFCEAVSETEGFTIPITDGSTP